MKITNKTNYSTRHLRKIFLACERNEGTNSKYRRVVVKYSKTYHPHGYAWMDSNCVVIQLPKIKKDGSQRTYIHTVAQLYIHEVGHNLNLDHKDMASCWQMLIDFLEDGKIEFKSVGSPKKPSEVNEEKARKKLAEREKKSNKAKTFVKKYQKKVKYYDKKKEDDKPC